jgi:Raf kinase inhibitor-like YbhB/YbcL family protein
MKRLLLGLVLVSCSNSSDRAPTDGAASDTATTDTGGFALTSTAFAESGTIPTVSTCKGANTSPPLAWAGAPSGAQSFAVVLTDLSLTPALQHWVIYDIAASATGLPANVENVYQPGNVTGAHQTGSVNASVVGYYGPCPPKGPAHSYQFQVYALDVAALPGTSAQTTRADAVTAITMHKLASATVTGSFTSP